MSVKHFLLPISDTELASLLTNPESARALVEARDRDVQTVHTQGIAIISLIAADKEDPRAFLEYAGPEDECGWIGDYSVGDDGRASCQVDMGYGPARYFKKRYVQVIAESISGITVDDFAARFDAEWLEKHNVYPGNWNDEGSGGFLVDCFETLRRCVIAAARKRRNLLIWWA